MSVCCSSSIRPSYDELKQEYAAILRKCSKSKSLSDAKRIHARVIQSGHSEDRFLANLLMQMYGQCRSLQNAQSVFDAMASRNEFSWAILISACVRSGSERQAIELYHEMDEEPDMFVFSSVISACARLKLLEEGKAIHSRIRCCKTSTDVAVQNSLVTFYAKCGCVDQAKEIFDRIKNRDVVSWNAMVAANAQCGRFDAALELYREMKRLAVQPDSFTYASLLEASSSRSSSRSSSSSEAEFLHKEIRSRRLQTDLIVGTALMNMYLGLNQLDDANEVFSGIRERDVLCWNTIIAANFHKGSYAEALKLFWEMDDDDDVRPNAVTFAIVLGACSGDSGTFRDGKLIHNRAMELGVEADVVVGTALVNFYSRCGLLGAAREIFDGVESKDAIAWTAMLAAYARHGQKAAAMKVFSDLSLEGVALDAISFTSIFGACSHAGLVEELRYYFVLMTADHGVTPQAEHFRCVINLLGRAGRVDDAEELIRSLPLEAAQLESWMVFLDACKTHRSAEQGAATGHEILQTQPEDGAPYLLVSES